MQTIGRVSKESMGAMQRRGMTPEQAVRALIDEGKRRYPGRSVILQPSNLYDGFDLIAM